MHTLLRLTTTEARLLLRDPLSVIFAIALPPVLLVVLGAIPSFRTPDPGLDGLRVIDIYVPVMVAIAIATPALNVVPQHFAGYRESGVLRRMRTTPAGPGLLLGAQLLMSAVTAFVTMTAVLVIARIVLDVGLPQAPLGYLVGFALTASAMLAIGLLIAALAPGAAGAGAIGLVLFFPMLFFAGLWLPRAAMSDTLRTVSDLTPLGAGVQSLQDAAAGAWPQPLHLVVLLTWTVLAGGVARRYFRWE